MNAIWFVILAGMLIVYAVLDGYDLGVGMLLLYVARSKEERGQARDSIAPVWNGNEVWLIAAGGAMFMAFPRLYSASFSGFYLPLMLVLWLLIFRGVGFEFRHTYHHFMWTNFWDLTFSGASALLAVVYGVAVGNVLRGVPLSSDGVFQGSFSLLLNPFSVLGGVVSLVVLALHGAAYLAFKTDGGVQIRARSLIFPLWLTSLILIAALSVFSFLVRPNFAANYLHWPILIVLPIAAAVTVASIPFYHRKGEDRSVFAGTSRLIIALLGSAAAGLFPRLLPSLFGTAQNDLTIYNAASNHHSLWTALVVNAIALIVVIAYTTYVHIVWGGKVRKIGY
jgi:cytochrome d ubiquinol oxidase subunit II